jgi:hypothetical protein
VALDGQTDRAMVVSSTAQAKRRWQRLARDVHASAEGRQAGGRVADTYAYVWQADAEVAAARLRARQTPRSRRGGASGRTTAGWPRPSASAHAACRQNPAVWAQVHAPRTRRDHGAQTGRGGLLRVADQGPHRGRSRPPRRGGAEGVEDPTGERTALERPHRPADRQASVAA